MELLENIESSDDFVIVQFENIPLQDAADGDENHTIAQFPNHSICSAG
jgi:hypothetical protein